MSVENHILNKALKSKKTSFIHSRKNSDESKMKKDKKK